VDIVSWAAAAPSFAEKEEPTYAEVEFLAAIIGQKIHRVVRRDEFGVLGHEICTG